MASPADNLELLRDQIQELRIRESKFTLLSLFILAALFLTISSAHSLIKNDDIDFAVVDIQRLQREIDIHRKLLEYRKEDLSGLPVPSGDVPYSISLFQDQNLGGISAGG